MKPLPALSFDTRKYLCESGIKVWLEKGSSDLSNIESVFVFNLDFQNAQKLKNDCKRLKKLTTFLECKGNVLNVICDMEELIEFRISLSTNMQLGGLKKLAKLEKLQMVDIFREDHWISQVSGYFPRLQSIGVVTTFNHMIYNHLKPFKELKQIQIRDMLKQQIIALVTELPYLTSIQFRRFSHVNDQILKVLCQKILHLKSLSISSCQVSGMGLRHLQRHSQHLQNLKIDNNSLIREDGIMFIINKLKKLRLLAVSARQYSEQVLVLMPAGLPFLQMLQIQGESQTISTKCVNKCIQNMPQLTQIIIENFYNNQKNETPHDFGSFMCFFGYAGNNQSGILDSGYFYLSKLRQIKQMNLQHNGMTTIGVLKMMRNVHLTNSTVFFNAISQRGKRNLRCLKFNRQLLIRI